MYGCFFVEKLILYAIIFLKIWKSWRLNNRIYRYFKLKRRTYREKATKSDIYKLGYDNTYTTYKFKERNIVTKKVC